MSKSEARADLVPMRYRWSLGACALTVGASLMACALGSPAPVDEEALIGAGDTSLHAAIRGRDAGAPILLYLHGGPGSPLGVPIFRAYGGRLLEDDFIVVYLHQRGIMKSPRIPDSGHRIDRYVDDVRSVVDYLGRRFPGRRLSLLGHSWGGVLAYLYLSSHSHGIDRLVAVAAPVDVQRTLRGRAAMILEWAMKTGNDEAIRDLTPLQEARLPEDAAAFRVLEKWSPRAYGGWARNLSRERVDAAIDYEASLPLWLPEQRRIEELLLPELLQLDLRDEIGRIGIPMLCIVGKDDVDVPWRILQDDLRSYGGSVDLRIFEHSHHMPFIDEEELFARTVAEFLSAPDSGT